MAAAAYAVETNDLCRRYGRRWALLEAALQVPAGTVMLVAGRNGAGKSTMLRVIATALRPDRGTVLVEGFDSFRQRNEVRKRIALLGHYSYAYEALSPLQNLQVAAGLMGVPSGRKVLLPLLEQVGLGTRADDPVQDFSAGMRKRFAIARVLLQKPRVALLDEPYGELDPPGFRLVDGLVRELRSAGSTVLMASHLLERGAALCDVGVVLEQGRVIWSGPARDLPALGGLAPAGLPEEPKAPERIA